MNQFLLVFLGGGLGSVIRFMVATLINSRFKPVFPFATLVSNLLSCIILAGLVIYFNQKGSTSQELKLLLIVGLCGGFSTFSTFSFETLDLLKNQNYAYAIANIVISITTCLGVMVFMLKKYNY